MASNTSFSISRACIPGHKGTMRANNNEDADTRAGDDKLSDDAQIGDETGDHEVSEVAAGDAEADHTRARDTERSSGGDEGDGDENRKHTAAKVFPVDIHKRGDHNCPY
jgi:hypothetical protein